MGVLSRLYAFFGGAKNESMDVTHPVVEEYASVCHEEVAHRNASERSLLTLVARVLRERGIDSRLSIQNSGACAEHGRFLVLLPFEDTATVEQGIRDATISVANEHQCTPVFAGPFMYAGGVLVMRFGAC